MDFSWRTKQEEVDVVSLQLEHLSQEEAQALGQLMIPLEPNSCRDLYHVKRFHRHSYHQGQLPGDGYKGYL